MSLEDERPALLGLQLEQEPNGACDPLAALQPLLGVRSLAGDPLERVAGVVGARAPADARASAARASASRRVTTCIQAARCRGSAGGDLVSRISTARW